MPLCLVSVVLADPVDERSDGSDNSVWSIDHHEVTGVGQDCDLELVERVVPPSCGSNGSIMR